MQIAKEKYFKAAEYYAQNKESIKGKWRERYKNLSQEKKGKIKAYQRRKYQEIVQYEKKALKNNFLFFSEYKNEWKNTET